MFYTTDALSQLPIIGGQEVRVFVLKLRLRDQAFLPGGPNDAMDRYQPVALPLHGFYDDHGWLRDITDDTAAASVRYYFASVHDLADLDLASLDRTLYDLNDKALAEEQGQLIHPEIPLVDKPLFYGIAMIAEPIYQAFVSAARAISDCSPQTTGEEWEAAITGLRTAIVERPWGFEYRPETTELGDDADNAFHMLHINAGASALYRYFAKHRHDAEICNRFVEFCVFLDGMRMSRRSLQPQSGNSQVECLDLHRALLSAAVAQAEQIQRELRWDEDEAEADKDTE